MWVRDWEFEIGDRARWGLVCVDVELFKVLDRMIFTNCPNCEKPKVIGWEAGARGGWIPARCVCNQVFWIQATSFNGMTYSHEGFLEEILKNVPEQVEKANQIAASTVVDEEVQ